MSERVIFLGPSAPPEDLACAEAEIRPPVAQGDIFRAVHAGARVIGIVDGYFDSTRSIWHKEILWALGEGVEVFGAASMGALRAAELHPLGVRGVGWVFEAFASGRLEDDDEVAIVHAPETLGFRPVSEAMVNVRCTLDAATTAGLLDGAAAAAIAGLAKGLYYADRDWPCILEEAGSAGVEGVAALEAWLPKGRVDIKRQDAIALAEAMQASAAVHGRLGAEAAAYEPTALAEAARRAAIHDGGPSAREDLAGVVDEWRLHDPAAASGPHALLEAMAAAHAAATGDDLDEDAMLEVISGFRQAAGIEGEAALAAWLASRQLSEARLLAILARDARLRQARARLTGLTETVLQDRCLLHPLAPAWIVRAAEKRRRLDEASRRGKLPGCSLSDAELLDWRRATFGQAAPAATPELLEAIRREHQYRSLDTAPAPAAGRPVHAEA